MVGVSSQSSIICCCILWSLGCCNPEYLLHPYGIYCCDYPFLKFALQRLPCDNGVCCPIPPIPERPTVFSSQNSQESSNVDSITSSLPITECPATMKCVREDFCNAKGVMVPFRVSLTEQEKRQRGKLIVSFSCFFSTARVTHCIDDDYFQPCMQPSGSFAVCCTAPQEQQEVRNIVGGPSTISPFLLSNF